MIQSKNGQRIGGAFLLALGAGFTVWEWHTALYEGYYYPKAATIFPAFAVLGLGAIFSPIDVEKLRAEHGVEKPTKFAHYPPAWKVLFFVAIAAGLGNWLAISQRWPVDYP